jgi:hypothetical protein
MVPVWWVSIGLGGGEGRSATLHGVSTGVGPILVKVCVYRVGGLHGDSMVGQHCSNGCGFRCQYKSVGGGFCTMEGHCEKRLACFPSPGRMSLTKTLPGWE